MGTVYKISCKCGYNKKLYLGSGLTCFNIESVYKIFSQEKLKKFKEDIKKHKVKAFEIENVAAFCENCKDILQTSKLNIELKDESKYSVINPCPICSKEVSVIDKISKCPICKGNIEVTNDGLWD